RDSATYGQWEGYVLDDEKHHQLYVPVGFAHGFCVLSDTADVTYLVSSLYNPETESGILWNDPGIGVEWPVEDPLLSQRDIEAPTLSEVAADLPW
ncbi:MAG TPA: dTDP-4-dehydrorhamnose 3,5-epimerase family protein, partial [Solirubrobacterales bacterium]|nr:dTDP-4-dehydrorhamnose 3,5-epimerase family protein [Solirubrobacterales bacterium]